MASATNPRVRRLNQMLRYRNQNNIPENVYFGKPTLAGGFGNQVHDMHTKIQNETTKTLLQWNYNNYPNEDGHFTKEENSGLVNTYYGINPF